MTSHTIAFTEPVQVLADTPDFLAESALLLEVHDHPALLQLSVDLQFQIYPETRSALVLYQGDEYEALGDWTYQSLLERVKLYYESGRSFPLYESTVPVEEEPAPEGE